MFHANWPHATQLLPHAGARKTPSPPSHSWYTLTLMRPLSTEPHLSTFQTAVWFIYNNWSPPRWQRTLGSCHDGSNDQLLWSRQSTLKCWVNESLIHFFNEEEWQEPNHCPARHFPCNHTPLLSGLQTFSPSPRSRCHQLCFIAMKTGVQKLAVCTTLLLTVGGARTGSISVWLWVPSLFSLSPSAEWILSIKAGFYT